MSAVKIDLTNEEESKFRVLKKALGLSADTEVVRYAVNQAYLAIVGKAEVLA